MGDVMEKKESKVLEFKELISNSFLKTISAFANFRAGKIIFGINDKGEILGLKGDLEQLSLDIENKINDNIHPRPNFSINVDSANRIITLEIPEGKHKPYLYKNKAYKRNGTATVEMDRVEFNRLMLEGINQNFEELPSKNQNLTFDALEKKLKEQLNIEKLNIDILKTLELYSDDQGYNVAAELLSDSNHFLGIDVVRFGNNINEFYERQILEGISILEMYQKSLAMFRKYYLYEVVDGAQRKTVERIPENAFREALSNAIVHRTWDVNASIKIALYPSKIEISSPGGLLPGIDEEEYLDGQISMFRNPIIGNLFFRLKYIEKFGTGISRIRKAYEKNIVQPEFKIYANSISVLLPTFNTDPNQLDEQEKQIYLALEKRELTRIEIQEITKFSKDKTIRLLNDLQDKNIIQRTGKGRGTRYHLFR